MKLVDIYRCLCDETRLRLLHLLSQGPLPVSEFESVLHLPQVTVSKHLAYLRRRGLVNATRRGQWVVYSLPERPTPELDQQLRCLERCLTGQLQFGRDLQRLRAIQPARHVQVEASSKGRKPWQLQVAVESKEKLAQLSPMN